MLDVLTGTGLQCEGSFVVLFVRLFLLVGTKTVNSVSLIVSHTI